MYFICHNSVSIFGLLSKVEIKNCTTIQEATATIFICFSFYQLGLESKSDFFILCVVTNGGAKRSARTDKCRTVGRKQRRDAG